MHTTVKSVLAVFIGGLAGSAARIGITLVAGQINDYWWPYPTLLVNLIGSFVLGFLGAFTTLSAISLDVAVPIVRHGVGPLIVMGSYAIGSIIMGLVSAIVGLRLGARRAGGSA